jgi:poly-gamma-glutamate capsule biosynthesis protein CapA/YwtB (metallophosphatase superfamily)
MKNFPKILLCLVLITSFGKLNAQNDIAATDSITIAAVGDIMMGSCYPQPLLPADSGRHLFGDCMEVLQSADLAFGNLEGPLCDSEKPAKRARNGKAYVFRTPSSYAENLAMAGFDILSLANNHANDFGPAGYSSTQKALERTGVKYAGKGGATAEFNIRGITIGVIALAAGSPPGSVVYPAETLKEIPRLAGKYDILIISVHGGSEGRGALHIKNAPEKYLGEPRGHLIKFAHDAIDLGADLIIGHGPHVPRAMEVYKDRLIAYSLGNFCTYGGMSLKQESGYAPLIWTVLDNQGKFLDLRIHSFIQEKPGGPKLDDLDRAGELMRKLSGEDFPRTNPFIER